MKYTNLLAFTLCLCVPGLLSAQGQSDSLRPLPQKGSTKSKPKNALRTLPAAKRDAVLLGVAFLRPNVQSGKYAVLKLSLSGPAPKHGYSVHLTSTKRAPLVLPKKVSIPEGAKSFVLTLKAGSVDAATTVEVRANSAGNNLAHGKAAKVIVEP